MKLQSLVFTTFVALALTACSPEAKKVDSPITSAIDKGRESGDATFDHSGYDALLRDTIAYEAGRVDYKKLADRESELDAYLASLGAADVKSLGTDEQLALFINAYNAYTLKLILEHYPGIGSIRDIDSPWKTRRYEIGGQTLSLDDIEHGILRPIFRDERIHFAVNCAAIGCPALADFAYTGSRVQTQLDEVCEAAMGNPRYAQVDQDTLRLTKIMDWYGNDFTDDTYKGAERTRARWAAKHGPKTIDDLVERTGGEPDLEFLEYDWSLNDVER